MSLITFARVPQPKKKSELNHFLPTEGRNHLKDGNWKGVKSSLFLGTAFEVKVILITYETPTRPAESDFNHSENQHNAPVSKLKKYAISMFFASALFAFRFPAE